MKVCYFDGMFVNSSS